MADKILTLTVPEAKVQRFIDATKFLFPIPQINTGTPQAPVMENEFTDNQWSKEAWRRYIIDQVQRYEIYQAKEAVDVSSDDELVS